jgi:hypothetical protein
MYSVALGHKSSIPTVVDPIQIIPNDAAERHDT